MTFFKIFIITLKNRPDREKKIKDFYKKFTNNNLEIVYGANKVQLKKYKKYITTPLCNHICTIPMVGCASSHILVWEKISRESDDYLCIVIEDDTFIDIEYLEQHYDTFMKLFSIHNEKLFLQLVGEGVYLNKTEKLDKLFFESYTSHLFLGAYMLNNKTALDLFTNFKKNKISYHIDFSLNFLENIDFLLLKDDNVGKQAGLLDSNMRSGNSKLFQENKFERLFYSLNLPLFLCGQLVITFGVILFFLLMLYTIINKNFFLSCILGLLFFEIIKKDI